MKSVITALLNLIKDCNTLALHHRLNRICSFITEEAPMLVEVLIEAEQENERLKQRITELEQQLKEGTQ